MTSTIPPRDVVARLEQLLPGLGEFAAERAARGRARMAEIWARVHPDRPPPFHAAPESALPGPDTLFEHAEALGWNIDSRNLGSLDDDDFVPTILGDLPTLAEPLLVVTDDDDDCHRVPAEHLTEFVDGEPAIHRHGDALFICTVTPRIVILHHENWRLDLTSPRGT